MSERSINASIKSKLVANEPFQYAHLVKFERPFDPVNRAFRTNTNRYAYYTDAAHDIKFNDGNGLQTYRANRITSIGQYSETTIAKATTMNLTLAAEDLGAKVTVTGAISLGDSDNDEDTIGTFTPGSTIIDGEPLDFVEKGFKEGDKIKFAYSSTTKIFIIHKFTTNNTVIQFKRTGTDSDDASMAVVSSTSFTITLESDELTAVLQDRGITVTSTAEANPSFLHRKVEVHKVFIDPDTGSLVGGNTSSILVFKGLIASVNIKESPNKTQVQWSLTSHWGDFEAVQGRITTDEIHRAINPDGSPNEKQAVRPEYASDLGFLHAETSLNTIANYKDTVTKFRQKSKRRGLGFRKKYWLEEYQEEVDREVDLNIHLSGKQLPIVYGVQRIEGIPVFADTLNNDSKVVYVVHAICEGEIHGFYNLFIEDTPLICTDDNDYDVRHITNGAGKDTTQLQCYGNMSKGETLNGALVEQGNAIAMAGQTGGSAGYVPDIRGVNVANIRQARQNGTDYTPVDPADVTAQALSVSSAEGTQDRESFSITHPHTMSWSFFSGRANQTASNQLITIAEKTDGGNFKRQADYYTGNLPYWAENHRLLDTAYVVSRFEVAPDSTTIPEIEFTVKGKVLECYNYDDSYIPDAALGSSDNAANFTEGDLVTVQYSSDGSSWTTDTSGNWTNNTFKILDKYTFTTARGAQHTRFRLDKTPSLGITNGTPTRTWLRLKSGSNYWHMITWNYAVVSTETAFPNNWKAVTTWGTNGSDELTAAVSTDVKSYLNIYGSDNAFFQFRNSTWNIGVDGLEYAVLRGVWNGDTLTFPGTNYSGLTNELNGTTITTATKLRFSLLDNNITSTEMVGCLLKNVSTGEEREITAFDATNEIITIETPFFTNATEEHKFIIDGRGKDLRSSSNPAIQTLDYVRSPRYGKNLADDDLDLGSFITSAKLCDTRSDITINVESAANVAVNDIFTLTHDGASNGNHVASGKVLSVDTTNNTVTLTQVINKFLKKYSTFTSLIVGDVVYTEDNKFYRAAAAFTPVHASPTHTSGTNNNLTYIGQYSDNTGTNPVQIFKTAGNGTASSLNIRKTGDQIEYSLYDSDWVKYWRYYGWEQHHQRWVTRHQTNFILDTGKSVFANMNALLDHFNGILSYENGKYVLNVETQETAPAISLNSAQENINPYYIEKSDIIGSINLKDNSQRNAKNTIKASIADPQNNYGSRSITFFNSDFLEADRNVQKTAQFPFTGITNYYNGRIGAEKELFQSRFSKEISFTIGPRGILLRAGQVIALTYEPFGWTGKMFRIENLSFAANCNVTIKAREYDDSIYEITKQRASQVVKESAAQYALDTPGAPSSLTATTDKSGSVILGWANASDYKELTDSTEIWYSSTNNRANATLLRTIDKATSYSHTPAVPETKYYWVRHRRMTIVSGWNKQIVHSAYFPTSATGGVTGTCTALSAGATSIKLLPSSHVIDWNKPGTDESSTINFTTDIQGMEGTIYYEFLVDGSAPSGGAVNSPTSTFTLPDADEPGPTDAPILVTVKARQTSAGGDILAQDVVSIYAIQDGQNTVTSLLTNEAHTVPADNDGTVSSFSGAGGTYKVYYGNTEITSNAKVTYSVVSESGVDVSINSSTGVYTVASMSADTGTATFRTLVKGSVIGGLDSTDDQTRDKVYTISKAKAGAGTAGTSNALVYAYQRSASTLTSDAGQVTVALTGTGAGTITTGSLANGWLKEIPSGSDDLYVIAATASGTGSTDTIAATEWTDPVLLTQTGTDGLNSATVQLYQLTATSSAPSAGSNSGKPEGNATYTFASASLGSFATNARGWSTTQPSVSNSNPYLWTITATAASTSTTDVIADSEWSSITKLIQPGTASISNIVTADNPWVQMINDYEPGTGVTTTYSPTTVTITANTQNTTNATGSWTASDSVSFASTDNTIDSNGIATATVAAASIVDGMTVKFTLHSDDGSLEDYVTLRLLNNWSELKTSIVENEFHLLQANADGTIKSGGYSGSATELRVFQGAAELDYLHTASSNGDLANGQWYITGITTSGITAGAKSSENYSGGTLPRHAQIADHSSAATNTDVFTIAYAITAKALRGTGVTNLIAYQRIGKTKQGDNLTQTVSLYKLATKNPGTPSADGTNAPSGWSFTKPAPTANNRIYQSQGTLNGDGTAYSWAASISESSNQLFTFRLNAVPDGVNTYEVNSGDHWIRNDNGKQYIAQADNSDAISTSEWKEVRGYDDKFETPGSLPDVELRSIGDMVLIGGIDIYICVDL